MSRLQRGGVLTTSGSSLSTHRTVLFSSRVTTSEDIVTTASVSLRRALAKKCSDVLRRWGSERGSPPLRLLLLDRFLLARAIPQVVRAVRLAQELSAGMKEPSGGDTMGQCDRLAVGALRCARDYGVLTAGAQVKKIRLETYNLMSAIVTSCIMFAVPLSTRRKSTPRALRSSLTAVIMRLSCVGKVVKISLTMELS